MDGSATTHSNRVHVHRRQIGRRAIRVEHTLCSDQVDIVPNSILRRIDLDEYDNMSQTCDIGSDSDHSTNGATIDCCGERNDDLEITRKMFESLNLGGPRRACKKCNAIVWFEERNRKHRRLNDSGFSICCLDGKVKLPLLQRAPRYLHKLMDFKGGTLSRKFREHIRKYNSMFALTSMGGKIDKRINNGRGPYVFKLHGQNYHRIGSLLPDLASSRDSKQLNIQPKPRFAQLYIYNTEHEAQNRLNVYSAPDRQTTLDVQIVRELIKMFDENNESVMVFRTARDKYRKSELFNLRIKLLVVLDIWFRTFRMR